MKSTTKTKLTETIVQHKDPWGGVCWDQLVYNSGLDTYHCLKCGYRMSGLGIKADPSELLQTQ